MKNLKLGTGLKFILLYAVAAERMFAADPLDTWHVRTPPTAAAKLDLNGVAYGNGRWVVVGEDGIILSSADGVNWQAEVNPAPYGLEDILFANGMFVAFGTQWNNLLTSTDGQHWSKQTANFSGAFEMIHDGTRFLSVIAGSFVVASTNGVNWGTLDKCAAQYDIGGLAYGNGIYVEAGYKRTGTPPDLYTTTDLKEWTKQDSKAAQNLMNVGFGLGMFVAVGQKGTITTSPDGINWTLQTSKHTGFIWDVATDGKHLVAAAQWGRVLTSTDGVNWTVHETDLPWHLTDVAYGNGTFVAVGWDGQIVQSETVATPQPSGEIRLSNPTKTWPFEFLLNGDAGATYTIQATSDFKTWTTLTTVTAAVASVQITDDSGYGKRFYRAVKQ